MTETVTIRIVLPAHLRTLAHVGHEISLQVPVPATVASTLDALEARYPVLCGTIRDHDTLRRRPFIRYFACEEDISHQPNDIVLPEGIVTAREPLIILGAIAGG